MLKQVLVISALLFFAAAAPAEQRMETRDGFCHFVVSPDNDDYEVFRGVCDIRSAILGDNAVYAGNRSGRVCHGRFERRKLRE